MLQIQEVINSPWLQNGKSKEDYADEVVAQEKASAQRAEEMPLPPRAELPSIHTGLD